MDPVLTFLCLRNDGVASVMDLRACPDDASVERHIRHLLAEHGSCDAVEAWNGPDLVMTRARKEAAEA